MAKRQGDQFSFFPFLIIVPDVVDKLWVWAEVYGILDVLLVDRNGTSVSYLYFTNDTILLGHLEWKIYKTLSSFRWFLNEF